MSKSKTIYGDFANAVSEQLLNFLDKFQNAVDKLPQMCDRSIY